MNRRSRRSHQLVNLGDVARHAGVSPMTVSRVIGGSAQVSVEMRARVDGAIKATGYSPNAAARTLASADSLKFGLLYGNPSANFTGELLIEALDSGARLGCQLILEKCATARQQRPAADKLIKLGIGGVILPTPLCDSLKLLQRFESAGVPAVAVATGRSDARGLSVRIDNFRGAQEMTRYLLSLGHRKIGFIRGHPRQIDSKQRYDGFAAALEEAGLAARTLWVKQGYYTYRSGLAATQELLSRKDRPTAIFASNDDMAAGALAAAHQLKLDVPRDLSIVGFDDTPLASTIWPGLTTVRQPIDTCVRAALGMLTDEIRSRRTGNPPSQRQELVQLKLMKRESAGPPER